MSLIAQVVLVAALIAGMMLFRLLAERLITKSRLRARQTDAKCGNTECFRACDDDIAGARESVTDKNAMKRSACRAP
ncbi:MAG: hypothetical protein ACN4GT_14445 [Gammaproteobacteria bacterium]